MTELKESDINHLKSRFLGEILQPGDTQYDEARQVWNAMIDRRPRLIARSTSVEDVVQAVKFARNHALLISIRGGGHNIAGNAVCDDGLMLDLSLMKDILVDPVLRRASVGPGCTLADVDAATQKYGLATPLGINSTTGVAGLTLGGGFGWLSRKYGMTIDNLLSADVVLADGRKIHASETDNNDLFWALRGGDGNFGVVTNFEFKLHEVGPEILSGLIVFPAEQAKSVITQFTHFTATMPDELTVWVILRKAPPMPFIPDAVHGNDIVALSICYIGDLISGEKLIYQLRSFGSACGESIAVQSYTTWQKSLDQFETPGWRNYWKSHNFLALGEGAIDTIIEFSAKLPSPHSEIFIGAVGGQIARSPFMATAYTSRDANYVMNIHTRWESAAEDRNCIAWTRELFHKSKPFASEGAYVNFMSQDETDRVEFAYGEAYSHLVKVKRKFDPTNFFRMNQNIKPH